MNIFKKIFNQNNKQKAVQPASTGQNASTYHANNLNMIGSGNVSATWLGLNSDNSIYAMYMTVPQLRAVVDRLASAYIRGVKDIYNKDGDLQENEMSKLINNPHFLQGGYEFHESLYKNLILFDRFHVLKIQTTEIHKLILLPTPNVKIVPADDFDIRKGLDEKDFIKHYRLEFNGKFYIIDTNDVWTFTSGSLLGGTDGYLYPDKKLVSLNKPISNIEVSQKSRNQLMKGLGSVGMITPEEKDTAGSIPLNEGDVKELQEEFLNYNLADGAYKYLISKSALKWTPMTLPVKDFMFFEGMESDTDTICDVLNYPSILMASSQKDSKYSNIEQARELLYTDKIIPDALKIDNSFNVNFAKYLKGDYLKTSYGHLDIFQKDQKTTAETNKINSNILASINKQIFEKIINKEVAVYQLIELGYQEETAKNLLTENTQQDDSSKIGE